MNKYRTELLERLDKKANCKVGKQCGDICIPKQSKCQLNMPDIPKVSPELVKGVAAGAGILGMSTVSYLAFRAKYRAGFAESAQMAEKMANDVKVDDIPPGQTKITFATGGFYGPMGVEGKKKAEDYFSYKLKTNILDADHHVITHRNDEFNIPESKPLIKAMELDKEGKKPDPLLFIQVAKDAIVDHYKQTLETALIKGRNPEAVKLASEVIAYNRAYPDKEIYLTGHSAGGMINHEAAEILDKLKIKVNVVNFGAGYFGLTEKVGNSATIVNRSDFYFKTMAGVRDPIYIGETDKIADDGGHAVKIYMNSPGIVKTAKSLFNQKQNTKKDSIDNKGRKCGESHIPKKFKCKKNGEIQEVSDNTKLASVALAGIGLAALPVGAIAAIRTNYIANLPKSAEDVKRQGKAIDPGTLKDFGDKQDILFYQKGFNSHGDSTKLESHLNSLFENSGTVVRNNKDFNFPNIPIDSPDFKERFIQSAVATTIKTILYDGRNPESVALASEVYAYHLKYPDKPINIIGHSAGGMIVREASDILNKLEIKHNVAVIASPDFGLFNTKNYIAINSDKDPLSSILPNAKATKVSVEGHSGDDYLSDAKTVDLLKNHFKNNMKTDAYYLARADAMKKAKCKVGKPCGDICIPKKNECTVDEYLKLTKDRKEARIKAEKTARNNYALLAGGFALAGTASLYAAAIMKGTGVVNESLAAEEKAMNDRIDKQVDEATKKVREEQKKLVAMQATLMASGSSNATPESGGVWTPESYLKTLKKEVLTEKNFPLSDEDKSGLSMAMQQINDLQADESTPDGKQVNKNYSHHLTVDYYYSIAKENSQDKELSSLIEEKRKMKAEAVLTEKLKLYVSSSTDKSALGMSGEDQRKLYEDIVILGKYYKDSKLVKFNKDLDDTVDIVKSRYKEFIFSRELSKQKGKLENAWDLKNDTYLSSRADAMKKVKAKCKVGKPCGDVCIPKKNKCEPETNKSQKNTQSTDDNNSNNLQLLLGSIGMIAAIPVASGIAAITIAGLQSQGGGGEFRERQNNNEQEAKKPEESDSEKELKSIDDAIKDYKNKYEIVSKLKEREPLPDEMEAEVGGFLFQLDEIKEYMKSEIDYYADQSKKKQSSIKNENVVKMLQSRHITEGINERFSKLAIERLAKETPDKAKKELALRVYEVSRQVYQVRKLAHSVGIKYQPNESRANTNTGIAARKNDSALSTQERIQLQCKILLSRASKEPIAKISKVKATSNGSLSGLFSIKNKTFKFDINDKNITYSAVTARIDSFQRFMRFDAKKKKCKIGIACGETCIGSRKKCELSTSAIAKPSEMRQLKMTASKLFVEQNPINATKPEKSVNDYEINPDTKQPYTIRDLKKIAGSRGIFGYGSMTMKELKESLALNDKDPDSGRRIAESITKRRTTSSKLIDAAGLKGKNKGAEGNTKKTISELLDNWKRIEALSKFAGNNTLQWSAAAVGAFLIGTTVRTYEKVKEDYRDGFDESAKIAQERAVKINLQHPEESNGKPVIRNGKQVMTSKIKQDNITFAVGSGKGHGAEEIKSLLLDGEKGDKSDEWLKKSHYIIPFNLQETGSPKLSATGNPTIDAANDVVNGFGDSMRNWRQKRNQDSVDLAAQIYAHAIAVDQTDGKTLVNANKKINLLAHGYGGQVTKEALEILARMEIKGSPPGKEVLKQVNAVYLGTPHFGFAENVSRRQRTIVSQQDPVAMLPTFGDGARQQWISSVPGHAPSDYLKDPRVRESVKEAFGYYQGSPEEIRRTQRKQRARLSFKPKSSKPTKPPENKQNNSDSYNIQYQSTIQEIVKL